MQLFYRALPEYFLGLINLFIRMRAAITDTKRNPSMALLK